MSLKIDFLNLIPIISYADCNWFLLWAVKINRGEGESNSIDFIIYTGCYSIYFGVNNGLPAINAKLAFVAIVQGALMRTESVG